MSTSGFGHLCTSSDFVVLVGPCVFSMAVFDPIFSVASDSMIFWVLLFFFFFFLVVFPSGWLWRVHPGPYRVSLSIYCGEPRWVTNDRKGQCKQALGVPVWGQIGSPPVPLSVSLSVGLAWP